MRLIKEKVLINGNIQEINVDLDTDIRFTIAYIGEHGVILPESEADKAIEYHITEYDENNHAIMHHKFIVNK